MSEFIDWNQMQNEVSLSKYSNKEEHCHVLATGTVFSDIDRIALNFVFPYSRGFLPVGFPK